MLKPKPLESLERLTAEQNALIDKIRAKVPLTPKERLRMEIIEEELMMHRGAAASRRVYERLRSSTR